MFRRGSKTTWHAGDFLVECEDDRIYVSGETFSVSFPEAAVTFHRGNALAMLREFSALAAAARKDSGAKGR